MMRGFQWSREFYYYYGYLIWSSAFLPQVEMAFAIGTIMDDFLRVGATYEAII